jgi:hypothetical protein
MGGELGSGVLGGSVCGFRAFRGVRCCVSCMSRLLPIHTYT